MSYYKFCKKHFEYELRGLGLGRMENITEEWLNQGKETWEHIYKISTKNKAVDIIIFSSVDMRTNEVRDNGRDAVRLVMRWTTRKGEVFKRIGKHYRLNTLFKNMANSIREAQGTVFNLQFKEFTPSSE